MGRRQLLAKAAGLAGLAVATGLAAARLSVPRDLALPPALPGDMRRLELRAGPLSYYETGEGPPLLLVHSINAAGSAFEVGPLYRRAAATRRVFAPDLPGFGFSDRSERRYDIRLYVDAIHDMLDAIAAEVGPQPIDAVALSLSSEFLARAAAERPGRFRSLAFVTPTGFDKGSAQRRGPAQASREVPGLYRAFTLPIWKQALFDALSSRVSIRFFLKKTFGSDLIDEELLDYDYLTTHRPGAANAPYAFVSGRLFSADVRSLYEALSLPVLVLHGTRGDFQDFTGAGWTRSRPNWRLQAFDTGALVHFEEPERAYAALAAFWRAAGPSGEP